MRTRWPLSESVLSTYRAGRWRSWFAAGAAGRRERSGPGPQRNHEPERLLDGRGHFYDDQCCDQNGPTFEAITKGIASRDQGLGPHAEISTLVPNRHAAVRGNVCGLAEVCQSRYETADRERTHGGRRRDLE